MLKLTAQSQRLQLITDFLKAQAFERASFVQIHDYLKQKLPGLGLKAISRRSLEADLQILRTDSNSGIKHIQVARKHYYQLEKKSKAPVDISEGFMQSMLQQIVQNLGAKLPEKLRTSDHDFQDQFVFSFSGLNDDGLSLQLAATCLQAIEQQYLIQFLYKPAFSTYKSRLQIVAPLQIRFYEGRFYLVACEWSELKKTAK
ncbi:MAG: hypothetical protein ACKOBN_01850, partial [Flavobacteriales bacterium]